MTTVATELLELADELDNARAAHQDPESTQQLVTLREAANQAGKAFSGSWWGYHSRVYYDGLQPTPPGAHFSVEWGLKPTSFIRETVGAWVEYTFDDVVQEIYRRAGNHNLEVPQQHAAALQKTFTTGQSQAISLITIAMEHQHDAFLDGIKSEIASLMIVTQDALITAMFPKNPVASYDTTAIQQGVQSPPHISVLARTIALEYPYQVLEKLAELCRRTASHLTRKERIMATHQPVGASVFIGHGRSSLWRELKDFIQDRLHLPLSLIHI